MNIFCFDEDVKTEKLLKRMINFEEYGVTEFYYSNKLGHIKASRDTGSMVVFLSTRMQDGKKNSFHFAAQIRETFPRCHILFLSQYPEDIHLCLRQLIRPSAFLLKPIQAGEITAVLAQIRQLEENEFVRITTRDYKYNVESKNILFFSTLGKKLYAQLTNGEKIEFYGTISSLEKEHGNFVRCHSGFLVNRLYIKGVKKGELALMGYEETLPISQKYKTKVITPA